MTVPRLRYSVLLKFLSTVIILFLLLRTIQFDIDQFILILSATKMSWFLLSLSGVIVVLGIKALRWKQLLRDQQIAYTAPKAFLAYTAAYALGVVSPGRLGELVKVYHVRQETGAAFIPAFKATVSDRLFDLVFLLLFGVAGVLAYLGDYARSPLTYLAATGFLLACVIQFVSMLFRFARHRPRVSENRLLSFIGDCLHIIGGWRSGRSWFITAVAYGLYFLTNWFLFNALDMTLSIIETAYVISIVGLVLLIPISLAGFGTREVSLVVLLSTYGIGHEAALSFSVLQFFSFFVWGGIIGLGCWIINPVSFSILKGDVHTGLALLRKSRLD